MWPCVIRCRPSGRRWGLSPSFRPSSFYEQLPPFGQWVWFVWFEKPACVIIVLVEINVLIDDEFSEHLEPGWLQTIAEQTLSLEGIGAEAEMGLVVTGQERIRALNWSYLGKDRPTDVIAFYMLSPAGSEPADFVLPPDGQRHLGEVIISYPQAVIQSSEQGHSVKKEVAVLVIHGVLHLLGYEDETPELKELMSVREQEILSHIKIV